MKNVKKRYSLVVFLVFCCFAFHQAVTAQNTLSPQDKKTIAEFEKRAKDYSKHRERIERRLPKLPKEATAEQIESHKVNLQKAVQSARSNAKQGAIFTSAAAELIRKIIKNGIQGEDRIELRQTVLEGETKGVPLRVNYPYPETKEKIEMPPVLLLTLPQLPKQLRYRFVNHNLLLVDRENALIIDYMTNALP
jgi:hypothetical protein